MKLYILAFTHTETDGNFTFKMPTTNQDSNQGSLMLSPSTYDHCTVTRLPVHIPATKTM